MPAQEINYIDLPGPDIGDRDLALEIDNQEAAIDIQITEVERRSGRTGLVLYDDFSAYPDGSPNGDAPLIGENTWVTSGSVPPTVTDGKLSAAGSGYLFGELEETPSMIEAVFSFGGTGADNSCGTLSFITAIDISDALHTTIGPTGAAITVRKDGGNFDQVSSVAWSRPVPLDGTRVRIGMSLHGNRMTILGPYGEVLPIYDPRIQDSIGGFRFVYWQASTSGSTDAYIHEVAVYGETPDTYLAHNDIVGRAGRAGLYSATHDWYAVHPNTPWQIAIGDGVLDSGPIGGYPAIIWGTQTIRWEIPAAVSLGATSITGLPWPHNGVSSAVIGYGDNAETVTVSGSTGSGPYAWTVSTTTKAHVAGEPLVASSTRHVAAYYNLSNGTLNFPAFVATGDLFFGAQDCVLQKGATDLIRTGTGDSIQIRSGAWNSGHLWLGSYHIWVDSTGDLRIKDGVPSSDTDGTVVGTQS